MRKVLLAVAILFVASVQAARADVNPNAAPADEYFGPYQQSILEIRNRLDYYDRGDASAMLDPSVPTSLDHLQLAIRDWQAKYPHDPWLAQMLAHLVREYWRAGQSSSQQGMAALADLRSSYPDAPVTASTVALIYGSNADVAAVAGDSPVEVASAPSPYSEYVAPPVEQALPVEQAPPVEEAAPVEQAPPAEEAPPVEQAPQVEQAPAAIVNPAPGQPASGYDASRGYDTARGYDAARGYDVARGYHVTPAYDATRGYDAWRGYDAARGYSTAAVTTAAPLATAVPDGQGPPH